METLVVPEQLQVWWDTGRPNNMAKVLKSEPYTGRYPEHFTHVLTLEAPNCRERQLEMAYNARN